MPFTDPMADGVPIQIASQRALAGGHNSTKTLQMVREFRERNQDTPIVLMGYYNPIYCYGVERFLTDAAAAGVDGLIVVDLPPEHDNELCVPAREVGIHFIRLATPTTDAARLPGVLVNTSGFLYYVSSNGVTGSVAPTRCICARVPACIIRAPRMRIAFSRRCALSVRVCLARHRFCQCV